MVDYFSLALSHGLLLLAFWRLMLRDDLDVEAPCEELPSEPPAEPQAAPTKAMLRRA
jgi:hypothetical protein